MKAYYKTILKGENIHSLPYEEKPTDVYEYKLLEITDICCQEMKDALHDNAVGFGVFHDAILNSDKNINFADCSPYPEGAVWTEYAINFCPFCGKRVETEERERVTLKKIKRKVRLERVDYDEIPIE